MPPPAELIARLRSPGREFSMAPFWFWNGALDAVELADQLRRMAAQGVNAACPHPRFGMDRREYLEAPYWRAMDAVVAEAVRADQRLVLYDEYNWPSGCAGGRVIDGRDDLRPRGVDFVVREVGAGPARLDGFIAGEPESGRFEHVIAAFAVPAGWPAPLTTTSPIADRAAIAAWGRVSDDGLAVVGEAVGAQRIAVFFQAYCGSPSPLDSGSCAFVDFLNPEVAERFIALTHEAYRQRYGAHFGTTITGIFVDEPSTISAGPLPWTHAFAREFARRRGYDLLPHLPALVDEGDDAAWTHRAAYWQTVAELFRDAFLRPISRWCRGAGIALTGHIFEESPRVWPAAPQLMDWLREFDWPGLDALGVRVPPSGCKLPASVAALHGRPLMCEAMGLADGWNATPALVRRGLQFLAAMGVGVVIPHAFHQTIDGPQVECPPSYFDHNPYWPHWHRVAALSDRLCAFNRGGDVVAPIALYYAPESLWADGTGGRGQGGKPWEVRTRGNAAAERTADLLVEAFDLLGATAWDCLAVDALALDEARVERVGGRVELVAGRVRFAALALLAVRTIDVRAARAIARFASAGGQVVIIGEPPLRAWPPDATALTELRAALAASATAENLAGVADLPTHFAHVIPAAAVARFISGGDGVLIAARRDDGSTRWLVVNDVAESRRVGVLLPRALLPLGARLVALDVASGDPVPIAWRDQADGVVVEFDLDEHASVILVAADLPATVAAPARPAPTRRLALDDWTIQVMPDADGAWCALPVWRLHERGWQALPGWQQPGFDAASWRRVSAHDGRAVASVSAISCLLRTTLPPGADALRLPLPVSGEYLVYANGDLLEKRIGPPPSGGILRLPGRGLHGLIAIEVASCSALAGLTGAVQVRCAPVRVGALKAWSDLGLDWFSGRVRYSATVELAGAPAVAWLDLGAVQHCAEVWINGTLAAHLPWAPYRCDCARWLVAGRNEILVVVANTLANRFTWDDASPTRTGGSWGVPPRAEPSGLIGPVGLALS